MAKATSSGGKGLSRRNAVLMGLGALVAAGGGAAYVLLSEDETVMSDGAYNMKVDPAKDRILGDVNAPVTIVEYSSLTCPHCAAFHQFALPELEEKYIKTGKARYVIRGFPLDRLAYAAAALTQCADESKFFPFTEALYKHQGTWSRGEGNPAVKLFSIAKQVGFTEETFNACIGDEELIKRLEEVKQTGARDYSVRSTPTLFVNGKAVEDNSLEGIKKAIEPHLKG